MATVAELEAQKSQLESEASRLRGDLKKLEEQKTQLYAQQRGINRDIARQREIVQSPTSTADQKAQATAQATELEQQYNQIDSRANRIEDQQSTISSQIRAIDQQIFDPSNGINAQIEQTKRQAVVSSGPRQSTGQTVRDDQIGQGEGANPVNPVNPELVSTDGQVGPEVLQRDTNARAYESNETTGTDSEVRSLSDTQALSPDQSNNAVYPPRSGPGATIGTGAISSNDDGRSTTSGTPGGGAAVRTRIDNIFGLDGGQPRRIETRPNILNEYASYTYNVSIYLTNKEQYRRMLQTKQRILNGSQLLIRSGGAPNAGGSLTPVDPGEREQFNDGNSAAIPQPTLGRNEFFDLDFYVDDIRLESVINGKGTQGAHNVVRMSFKIIEPNGISFLTRLKKAVQQFIGLSESQPQVNYAAQLYLMVIRFYGYDEAGNPIKPNGQASGAGGGGDSNSIVEKIIPFQFTGIKFRIANKLVEYDCEAVCPQNMQGSGQMRGVIPFQTEFSSTSLKELLSGNQGPSNVTQTSTSVLRQTGTSIAAPSVPSAFNAALDSGRTPQTSAAATSINAFRTSVNANLGTSQAAAPNKADAIRKPNIAAGLCEALNRYQQEFVKKGLFTVPDEYEVIITDEIISKATIVAPGRTDLRTTPLIKTNNPNQQLNGATQSTDNTAKNASAFAGMSIVQFIDQQVRNSTYIYDQQLSYNDPVTGKNVPVGIPGKILGWYRIGIQAEPKAYDPKRNDYAYKITYQISPYAVNDVKSTYFPNSPDRGAHKIYNHWFTGQNTDILDFSQDYNYLYYIVINNAQNNFSRVIDNRDVEKKGFQPNSNQSNQGQSGNVNEPSANAADYLYSPSDLARTKLTIVGDPAWIQQGEVWSGVQGLKFNYSNYLPDGTINFEAEEALFRIQFNTPVDYDLTTGLQDPTQQNYNRTITESGEARLSFTYRAVAVTSLFRQGKFTQELDGVLITYPNPNSASASAESKRVSSASQSGAAASTASSTVRVPTGALSSITTSGVDTGEFGAFFGSGSTGGLVNYRPLGLSSVLDRTRIPPSVSSTLALEGFDNTTLLIPDVTPPTSDGQVVGPAAPGGPVAYQSGGVNQTVNLVPLTLNDGSVRRVSTAQEINDLYNAGLVNSSSAGAALFKLQSLAAAQQKPVVFAPPQRIKKDNG